MSKQISTALGILIIILLAGGVVGSSVLFLSQEGEEMAMPEEDAFKKDEIAEDGFEGWEIYRNEEYGFKIKYPNTWKESEIESYSYKNDAGQLVELASIDFINVEGAREFVGVQIISNPKNLDPLAFHKESCLISSDGSADRESFCEFGYKKGKDIVKGKNKFLQYEVLSGPLPYTRNEISGNGFHYSITKEFINYPEYEGSQLPEYQEIYDEMLISFQKIQLVNKCEEYTFSNCPPNCYRYDGPSSCSLNGESIICTEDLIFGCFSSEYDPYN